MGNANSYYNRVADYNPDELADGDTIEDEFNAVQRGFESVEIAIETIESEKANKSSPTFTGTPNVPTADADTSSKQIASTEFVIGQAANTAPLMAGVATAGTSKKFSRQDHVHPNDKSKVSISDLRKGVYSFATDTGIANAYICNLTPALDERREGQVIRFKVANTSNGACTVNDGVGVVPLVGLALSALQGGEMVAGGYAWIQWHPSVGTGSYVLLYSTGAPLQVADATKSKHAVALGQLATAIGTTHAQFDSSKKLATTEFVQGIGLKFASLGISLLANTTLSAAQANNWFEFEAAGLTATLPPLSSVPSGSTYSFRGYAFGGTIKCNSSELVAYGSIAGVNSITILPGETIIIVNNGNEWYQISGGFGGSIYIQLSYCIHCSYVHSRVSRRSCRWFGECGYRQCIAIQIAEYIFRWSTEHLLGSYRIHRNIREILCTTQNQRVDFTAKSITLLCQMT